MHNHPVYVEPGVTVWSRYLDAEQRGGGDVFRGTPYQRGAGALGNVFRSILSFAKPMAKTALKKVASTGLRTAMDVAQDALEGRNIGESLKQRGTEAGIDLLESARSRVARKRASSAALPRRRKRKRQIGKGLGHRTRRRGVESIKGAPRTLKKKRTKKQKDIFGY